MSKRHEHTRAAAVRSRRRGEPICPECAEAERSYLAAQKAKGRAADSPVIAHPPMEIGTTLPDGWTWWDWPHTGTPKLSWQRADDTLPELDRSTPSGLQGPAAWARVTRPTGRRRWDRRMINCSTPPDAVEQLVEGWLADDPTVTAKLASLPHATRLLVMRKLGYGPRTVPYDAVCLLDDVPVEQTVASLAERDAAPDLVWPWPGAEVTDWVEWIETITVEADAVEADDGQWVRKPGVARAENSTPLPDGWELVENPDDLAVVAPLRLGRDAATVERVRARDAKRIVINPDTLEVWVGIGGEAHSLGMWSSRDEALSEAARWLAADNAVRDWADPAPGLVLEARSPGWDAVQGAPITEALPQ